MKSVCTILDIGSSKVAAVCGKFSNMSKMKILAEVESPYNGFCEGEFFDEESLRDAITFCITNISNTLKSKPKKVFVGVPGEFCSCVTRTSSKVFSRIKRLTQFDFDDLISSASQDINDPNYTLIDSGFANFVYDNGNIVADNYRDVLCHSVEATVSLLYAQKIFLQIVTNILSQIGITKVEFVSSNLATAQFLNDEPRKKLFIDCGYITSEVYATEGEAITCLRSFSTGGGHITSDLYEFLHINFDIAEQLKRVSRLLCESSEEIKYTVMDGENPINFLASAVNKIVTARIDIIAEIIKKCLVDIKLQDYDEIYLTGGGIAKIFGVRAYLSKKLGIPVEIVAPPIIYGEDTRKSSVYGVLYHSLKKINNRKKSFWNIFFAS